MQDQIIIFMALAAGQSSVLCGELTLHTRTAIAVAEQLTAAKFTICRPQAAVGPWRVTCQGAGYVVAAE